MTDQTRDVDPAALLDDPPPAIPRPRRHAGGGDVDGPGLIGYFARLTTWGWLWRFGIAVAVAVALGYLMYQAVPLP